MSYYENAGWALTEGNEIVYQSTNLSAFSNSVLSAQKTYLEGIDVIRSIYSTKDSFSIVSTVESRTSGPAETLEGTYLTLDLAKETLLMLCKEDDEYYE